MKFPRNIFQLLGICFLIFFLQIFIFSLCHCEAPLIDDVKRSDHRYEIVNCQWWSGCYPGKIKFLKTSHFALKGYFLDFLKTFKGPDHNALRGYFLDCLPAWLISVSLNEGTVFQSQTGNTHLHLRICKNLVAVIFLSLPTLLLLNLLSAIQKPFKILRTYMNGAISNINWLLLKG